MASRRRRSRPTDPISDFPAWIAPQLTELVAKVPAGDEWAHEIKLDGYRMHARTDRGQVQLLTRTGLDWTAKYTTTAAALQGLPVQQAYIDGELCAVSETGVTSFSLMQAATDGRRTSALVFYAFEVLHLDGQNLMRDLLLERKQRLQRLLNGYAGALRYCDHQIGMGPQFYEHACQLKLEGVVSKRLDAPYVPGNRGLWLKTKCVNREEFVVVGWTDPEGSRPRTGALLLAYYTSEGASRTPVAPERG